MTSKSTVSASALGLAIYAAAHALLEENLSPPRLASTRLPAGKTQSAKSLRARERQTRNRLETEPAVYRGG